MKKVRRVKGPRPPPCSPPAPPGYPHVPLTVSCTSTAIPHARICFSTAGWSRSTLSPVPSTSTSARGHGGGRRVGAGVAPPRAPQHLPLGVPVPHVPTGGSSRRNSARLWKEMSCHEPTCGDSTGLDGAARDRPRHRPDPIPGPGAGPIPGPVPIPHSRSTAGWCGAARRRAPPPRCR